MIKFKELLIDYEYTRIILIGVGATGSRLAVGLMELNEALVQLDRKGIDLTLIDDDIVNKHNVSKQKYFEQDIGKPKATVLAERLSYTFNTSVNAKVKRFEEDDFDLSKSYHHESTIVISAVDNIETRKLIQKEFPLNKRYWFLDMGNSSYSSQVMLRNYQDINPKLNKKIDYDTFDKSKDIPSCSMAESLDKQSFLINQITVDFALSILSRMLIHGEVNTSEIYINLDKNKVIANEV